jgi:hypothetical protein
VSVLFGDPLSVLILLVLLFYGAPGDPMGAILFAVLLLRGVERLFVDLLGVLWDVLLHTVCSQPRSRSPLTLMFDIQSKGLHTG